MEFTIAVDFFYPLNTFGIVDHHILLQQLWALGVADSVCML